MAFAGIFQPFARLRWIRFGLLMRDRKFSRRFSVPQTTALAPFLRQPDDYRCYALSGVYDMRDSMDGMYDDNFYFNNPVDYMANQNDPWFLHQLASCDIHLATGCGPWEVPGPTYRMSEVLKSRGIAHHLDDWGPKGGHEWPYWHHQMWEYVGAHF